MNTQEFPKDKYGYEIPRCHYVNPSNGEACNAPPVTGDHYCFSHHPGMHPQREEAYRASGPNPRQPQPPLRIPPNLPILTLRTHSDVLYLYEDTINSVRQGEMDIRVANTLANLAMGALCTINSGMRAERLAILDAERAASRDVALLRLPEAAARAAAPETNTEDKAQKAAEREQEQAAQKEIKSPAGRAPERAETKIEKETENLEEAANTVQFVNGFAGRAQYGPVKPLRINNTALPGPGMSVVGHRR